MGLESDTPAEIMRAGGQVLVAEQCAGAAGAIPEISIILPVYNEAAALPELLTSLFRRVDERTEVIVVDDASTDDSADIALQFPCTVLQHAMNQGKGAAVRTGFSQGRGRFVIIMDADNTYPTDAIPTVVNLLADHDIVRCVRRNGAAHTPLLNRIGNQIFDTLLAAVYGLEGADHLSGLYGIRREALEAMQFTANGFDLEVEIGIKARAHRLRSASVPILYGPRLGEKKLRPWYDGWAIFRRVLALALLYNPGLMFVVPGLLLWAVSAGLTILLSYGPLETPYLGLLSSHSLIVASMGAIVGFQFVVFGTVAALYGVECGAVPRRWLIIVSQPRVRFGAAALGLLIGLYGFVILASWIAPWLVAGGGNFYATRSIVPAGMLLTGGVQLVLGTMFVSIFAGRVASRMGVRTLKAGQLEVRELRSSQIVEHDIPARDASLSWIDAPTATMPGNGRTP